VNEIPDDGGYDGVEVGFEEDGTDLETGFDHDEYGTGLEPGFDDEEVGNEDEPGFDNGDGENDIVHGEVEVNDDQEEHEIDPGMVEAVYGDESNTEVTHDEGVNEVRDADYDEDGNEINDEEELTEEMLW